MRMIEKKGERKSAHFHLDRIALSSLSFLLHLPYIKREKTRRREWQLVVKSATDINIEEKKEPQKRREREKQIYDGQIIKCSHTSL